MQEELGTGRVSVKKKLTGHLKLANISEPIKILLTANNTSRVVGRIQREVRLM